MPSSGASPTGRSPAGPSTSGGWLFRPDVLLQPRGERTDGPPRVAHHRECTTRRQPRRRPEVAGDHQLLVTERRDAGVADGIPPRCGLDLLSEQLEVLAAQGGQDGLELEPARRRVDGRAEAGRLRGARRPEAATRAQPVRTDLDVVAEDRAGADEGALVGLVGRLVGTEAHVAVGPEELRLTELLLEAVEQGEHRLANVALVDVLVGEPPVAGVVVLELGVEGQGCRRESGEAGGRGHVSTLTPGRT